MSKPINVEAQRVYKLLNETCGNYEILIHYRQGQGPRTVEL